MVTIIAVVEGHGEVAAVPVLIRRIGSEVSPQTPLRVPRPVRAPRHRFLKLEEMTRYVNLAARLGGPDARILILLDANGDCPAILGPDLLKKARKARSDRRTEVVLAKCEYEAWFLAAIESVRAKHRLHDLPTPPDVEGIRGAKEHLHRMQPYSPTADQAVLTARFDMAAARRVSPSFDKMWRAVRALLAE